jgi:hypothetical protein
MNDLINVINNELGIFCCLLCACVLYSYMSQIMDQFNTLV